MFKIGDQVMLQDNEIEGATVRSTKEYARKLGFEMGKIYFILEKPDSDGVVYLKGNANAIYAKRLMHVGGPW